MNIISRTLFQVSYIEKILRDNLQNKEIIYNYFICEKSTKLLDKHSLQEFLTNTKIENLTFLKSICNHCFNINKLWNNDLNDLPHKTLKERFIYSDLSDKENLKLINIDSEFLAIYLLDEKFEFYNSDLGKVEFFKEYYFYINHYSIPKIVQKCNIILYYLTACYPQIFTPKKADFKFENKFDQAEPKKVYDHFIKLVEKGYLSKEDLESYLILAFQDETPPKEKIIFSNKHIGNITSIFYKYYADAENTHGKQIKYAKLLGEYFKGFSTKKVMGNFAKSK
ncbi:hypothetical protein [uncultured Gelidibacter sp.]|uniref:hypothetical protein n=1 Tax=uncultured Gelidibacter sp. TaxID=259318 RepID=UPI002635C66E|nr:hypothetical protein [uncultured Gelidibacter sp.]